MTQPSDPKRMPPSSPGDGNSRVGIRAVSVYRPPTTIDNLEQGARLEADVAFITNKIGMLALTRKSAAEDTSDLAAAAVEKLVSEHGLPLAELDCLVLVTQNPDRAGLPHSSAITHKKLGLAPRCATFDIGLGCSGYVQGLSVIQAWMSAQGFAQGVLVTADPYSKIIDSADRDTALLFGDGASATWIAHDCEWHLGATDFGTQSAQCDALTRDASGHLSMNGRAVFNFAATQVPASIERLLAKAQCSLDTIDYVLLHQGSRYIVETLAKRIGAGERAIFAAGAYGNTVSSSIPMLLAENTPASAKRLLLCGFGVGLSWASCILERTERLRP